jgi:hypothetical protein
LAGRDALASASSGGLMVGTAVAVGNMSLVYALAG